MPIYPVECPTCHHKFEAFARVDGRHDIPCEKGCAGACSIDFAGLLPKPERRFSGTGAVSVVHGFHPDETNEARRLYPDHQHCIKDKGEVTFRDRSEERSFAKRTAELKRAGIL